MGEERLVHLGKGAYEPPQPGQKPKNKHWAWLLDCAPSGLVCPRARLARDAGMGNPMSEEQACRGIVLKALSEAWGYGCRVEGEVSCVRGEEGDRDE
jgi:hypothetical protein